MVMNTVYLTDKNISYEHALAYFEQANLWAKDNCDSYIGFHIQDVSDVSYEYDYITAYSFNDPKDIVLFQLKWS